MDDTDHVAEFFSGLAWVGMIVLLGLLYFVFVLLELCGRALAFVLGKGDDW